MSLHLVFSASALTSTELQHALNPNDELIILGEALFSLLQADLSTFQTLPLYARSKELDERKLTQAVQFVQAISDSEWVALTLKQHNTLTWR